MERRLAAILAADVVGYSRLMGDDEVGTLQRLTDVRTTLIEPLIGRHRGHVVKLMGDGILVEFKSVVDAVECAVAWLQALAEREGDTPENRRFRFRIGVNIGDVLIDGDDIFGDGVNVAARLEALAEPGGIALSDDAHRQVRDRLDLQWNDLGDHRVKNIARPVHVWHWADGRQPCPKPIEGEAARRSSRQPAIAVLPFANLSGDPDQEYFAEGIAEDIVVALSRPDGDRPKHQLQLQGPGGERGAGGAGSRRRLRPRRQRSQGRQSGPRFRPIDRREQECAYLGGPLRP